MRKRFWILIPPLDFSFFEQELKSIAWNFRNNRDALLEALDKLARDPSHHDARLYAYGLRAWPDRTVNLVEALHSAIENETCEEANRIRKLMADADTKPKRRRKAKSATA